MADTSPKTFPGVYTQITDQSFQPPQVSRFRPAFVGVCSKGPFDTPTRVRSLKEFTQVFGRPVSYTTDPDTGEPGTPQANSTGFFVADGVQLAAEYTNDITIVRVGNRLQGPITTGDVAGTVGTRSITGTAVAEIETLRVRYGSLYIKLTQPLKKTSVGLLVSSTAGTVATLSPNTPALTDTYDAATVWYSAHSGAANQAEGVLYAYSYATTGTGTGTSTMEDFKLEANGTVNGNKNDTFFTVANGAGIAAGDVFKIKVDNNPYAANTYEIRVQAVSGTNIYLESTDQPRIGFQAVPLQDNYGGTTGNTAFLYKAGPALPFLWMKAKTDGDWANGGNSTQGLYVRVRPGSKPGTKKLEVFENGALVETHDNLSDNPASSDAYKTRLAASQYIAVADPAKTATTNYHAANTVNPWDATYYASSGTGALPPGAPPSMPAGAINAGNLTYHGTNYFSGGQFAQGSNGNGASEADYAGVYDAINDVYTGVQSLKDPDNITCNMIFAPMDLSGFGTSGDIRSGVVVMDALFRTARSINAMAICDVPPGLTATEATDWHNGTGLYTGRPRIDSANIAIYWNWFTTIDRFTNLPKLVPPSIGAVRCFGITFQRDKPWYAAAGETRGYIPECQAVQFDRVGVDTRHAMYGQGNSVNPILKMRGQFFIYGERTMQRAESKLTAIHNVILVNYVVDGLSQIGRRFVFDPNDLELLVHVQLAFSEFLDKVRNERGIEDYELVVDQRNNTPETRNRREVIVDLSIVPTDVAERIFINAVVRESGAVLNNAG